MSYDILLFDADATLFDFEKAEKIAFYNVAEQNGVIPNEENFLIYKRVNIKNWKDFEKGLISKDVLMIRRFQQFYEEIGITNGDAAKFDHDYLHALAEESVLFADTLLLIERLYKAKKRIFLVTNGVALVQHNRLNKSPLKKYIENVFISEEIGARKPQKEFFDYVAKHIDGFEKDKAIVIGDSLTSDIQGAMNANLDSIWFNIKNEKCSENYKITFEANSLEEVGNILLEDNSLTF